MSYCPALGQRVNNDGFQRRNGQMHVLRNGQLRPMTRDARLPTGTTVTKDGFVVASDGKRTELAEGQGCDLHGRIVGVAPDAKGGLALNSPAPAPQGNGSHSGGRAPSAARAYSSIPPGLARGHGKKWKKKKGKKHKKWDD